MKHYLLLIAVAAITVIAVVAGPAAGNDTYEGNIGDLLLTSTDVPASYFIAQQMEDGWTFVPEGFGDDPKIEDGWTFVPEGPDGTANEASRPIEYDFAVFWNVDDDDDPLGNIIQIVERYTHEQIDEMFSKEGWTFVPEEDLEGNDLDDCRARVNVRESNERTYYFIDLAKKDIIIHLLATVMGDEEMDLDTLFTMARPILERI
ncbi:hypothetical protein EF808_06265 [archaeon]|nr:MAG: hypothetical protein EF808_06265 [archaeon]